MYTYLKQRYCASSPIYGKNRLIIINLFKNNATISRDIWRVGEESIAMFELPRGMQVSQTFLRRNTAIWKKLLISNDRNSVRWLVLGLSLDGACTDLVENLSDNSLKGDLSYATIFNSPLFSLFNTFNAASLCCRQWWTSPRISILTSGSSWNAARSGQTYFCIWINFYVKVFQKRNRTKTMKISYLQRLKSS